MSNDRLILEKHLAQRKKDIAPDFPDSRFFEYFCASEILKDFDLSHEDILSGMVGAGNDGGIDAIYVLLNGDLVHEDSDLDLLATRQKNQIAVYIMQAKRSPGFGEDAINKLDSSARELFDLGNDLDGLSRIYNSELLAIVKVFQDVFDRVLLTNPNLHFRFYYATLGTEVHPYVRQKSERVKKTILDHL